MTWVIADHVAGGAAELSVTKGQQVEVVEVRPGDPEWCLVRMPTSGSAIDSPPEGLVPLAVLKQPPPGFPKTAPSTSPNRRTADHELGEYPLLHRMGMEALFVYPREIVLQPE